MDIMSLMAKTGKSTDDIMVIMANVQKEMDGKKITTTDIISIIKDVSEVRKEPINHILIEIYSMLLTEKKLFSK